MPRRTDEDKDGVSTRRRPDIVPGTGHEDDLPPEADDALWDAEDVSELIREE